MKHSLVVLGSRKAGTTWIYENLKSDPNFKVNEMVKESPLLLKSNFNNADAEEYSNQFSESSASISAEINASLCYSDYAVSNISNFANDGTVFILILRNPTDFFVSRYIHSLRKGELRSIEPNEVIEESWVRAELDYLQIIERLESFELKNLHILKYELVFEDPITFYRKMYSTLRLPSEGVIPPLEGKINVARKSKTPLLGVLFSNAAKLARGLGFHSIVNIAKSTGVLRLLEQPTNETEIEMLRKQFEPLLKERYAKSYEIWEKLENEKWS